MLTKQQVRVSYLISTRNRAIFLDHALQNVRQFITTDDELIIMDGASSDNTAKVVERYKDIVTLFRSEPDCGEAHGFNKAILQSRGRFIKLLTDDDYVYPDAMRQAIAVMESHPEIDALIAGGESYKIDPASQQLYLVNYLYLPANRNLTDDIANIFYFVTCGLGLVLNRRVIDRVGLFDTTFRAVDTDYMGRMLLHNIDFRYLNIKLFRHITHVGSGVNNTGECLRDGLRTLLRNKAWSELFTQENCSLSAVAAVLGVEGSVGAKGFMRLIASGELMRHHKTGRILICIMVWIFQIHERLLRLTWKIKIIMRGITPANIDCHTYDVSKLVEPVWDGKLR